MKKLCIMAIIMAMLLSVSSVAMAEEDPLSLSDANVRAGQTIYLTLKLNTAVTGDAVGVSYTYDRNLLEAVVSSCTWSIKGTMSNFNREDAGVWASTSSQNLMGEICVLAFRVKSDVEFTDTTVSCTLVIKNGSQEQGTYTAQAKVAYSCEHSYGDWENGDDIGHLKTCKYCGATITAPHSLGSGVPTENPDDPDNDLLIYNCEICGYVRQVEIPKQQEEISNAPTHSTQEATEPPSAETNSNPSSTMPTESPTVTVPTAPQNYVAKETDTSTESTQPYRSDTSKAPQSVHTDTYGDDTDESSTQATASIEPIQPSEEHADSNHKETSSNKDSASSGEPQTSGSDVEDSRNDSSSNKNEGAEQPQGGQNATGTDSNPTTVVSYPDDSSNVITQAELEKVEINPAPTFPTTESTTPYKDYNEKPEETTASTFPPVSFEDAEVCTDPAHNHDHVHTDEEANTGNPALNAVIFIVLLTVAIGGAVLYLKKKRK